ncbi:uncharacterized protein UBRO_20472 [Ustilago bromivora]|uniref:Cas12f1-like TNB domain-containing protein n=1 Tax=Ustilago bromivora TaxID=307758 RepID=A0A1K0GJ97_9BASI|nr:uncharacterized protein UBRO_20472 [Ustilago bromivora]
MASATLSNYARTERAINRGPDVYPFWDADLNTQLRDNRSPFVNRRPHLLKCPVSVRQAAIDEALAARKAILTTYWNKNPPRGPIPTLSHRSKAKDRQNGFSIFLSPSSSTIVFDEGAAVKAPRTVSSVDVHTFSRSAHEDGSLGAPKLKITPKTVKRCSGGQDNTLGCEEDTWVKICLRSQRGRHFLKDHCKAVSQSRTTKLKAGHEWGIQLDRYGDWCFLLSYNVPTSVVPQEQSLKQAIVVKSVDPGVRTPFAVYSSDGCMLDVGSQDNGIRLEQLRRCNDKIQSCRHRRRQPHHQQPLPPPQTTSDPQSSQQAQSQPQETRQRRPALPFALSSVQRRKLQKRSKKVHKKLQQLINDLHFRMANYLATSSDIVIMPRMEVRKMIQRKNGNLHRNTRRRLLGWGHCNFINRLLVKCHDVAHDPRYLHKRGRPTVLLIQPEAYTSKTCSQCGNLNQRLGASKQFRCPTCLYSADRDHNGAFNMLIKAIRRTPLSSM